MAQARAAADSRGGSYGVPEASLRQAHREMVHAAAEYRSIFQPQEIAEILAGEQGERGHAPEGGGGGREARPAGWPPGISAAGCTQGTHPRCLPPCSALRSSGPLGLLAARRARAARAWAHSA